MSILKTLLSFQAFLSNEDLGDSLDSVEALIKKHEDFEKSLAAQEEKIRVRCSVRHADPFPLRSGSAVTVVLRIELGKISIRRYCSCAVWWCFFVEP